MLMTAADYRESLRPLHPRVFLDGDRVESVADEPRLAPGIAGVGVTYDFAHVAAHAPLMTVREAPAAAVNRMLHIDRTTTDLLRKLEAVRLLCQESGCAQRYLAHDALNAFFEATRHADEENGSGYHQRFFAYLGRVQTEDLALGIAMTDAKGDR
jgi:4-hydroxybutyryl-CoA dehydratase/vinylacetyl-CoA-Delta-isomerase